MPTSAAQSVATIDQFINAVGGQVKAADGSTPLSEPGSIGGETGHPVKKVDDRLEKAKEGFRSTENTKDVKEDQGAPSVENKPEAKAGNARRAASVFDVAASVAAGRQKRAEGDSGTASEDHKAVNMKVTGTGEDPSNETNSAKSGKEDPGSDHPARTDNTKIDGHKWAADTPLEKLASDMRELGNNICAQIGWLSQNQGNAPTAQAARKQAGDANFAPARHIDQSLAQQIGWEMAGLVNGTFDKRAADSLVLSTTEEIVKVASDDADRFIVFMDEFMKEAEGEPPMPGGPPPGGDPSGGMGGGPPPGGGMGGPPPGGAGGPGEDPGAMMAALGGGADAGGAPGGAGGMGGGGGAGGDHEAMQLAQILEELGVSPEELEQALQEEHGGGGGGPPPGGGGPPGGGMPPPGGGGGPPGGGMEAQAHDRGLRKQADSDKQAQARQYIQELVSRSRSRK